MPRKSAAPSLAERQPAPGGAAAVDRALSLLGCFRSGDGALTLAELAQRSGLHKSTALRLLASLVHAQWLARQADGRYAIGPAAARLHVLYAGAFSSEAVLMPVLRALVAATGESAAFHVRRQSAPDAAGATRPVRVCLWRVDSTHPVRDHVRAGDLLPQDRGAGARILIAFSPDSACVESQKDRETYAAIRAQGYCALVGDRSPELAGISAPVRQADGTLAGALTLTMPAHRFDRRWIAPVVAAAQSLDGKL